jgi:LysR family carnitine catabolism transcriptional activator
MINIRHLRAFVAVAEHLHFTRAAQSVYLTQPALSTLIRQLETHLDLQLLQRNTRVVELTPIGREFHATARKLVDDMDVALRDLKSFKALAKGRVRLAALPSLWTSLLPEALRAFHAAHPGIELAISDLPGEQIIQAVRNKTVDLAVTYTPALKDIKAQLLLRDQLMIVCPRQAPLARNETVRWRDLSGHPIIAMAQGTTIRTLIQGAALAKGISLNIVLEPHLMPTAISCAESGLGAAILPSSGVPPTLPPSLVCLELVDPVVRRDISLVTLAQAPLSPSTKALYDALVRTVRATGRTRSRRK